MKTVISIPIIISLVDFVALNGVRYYSTSYNIIGRGFYLSKKGAINEN